MDYIIVFIRVITIMSLLLFSIVHIMGRRPIGEMPVFDFLVIIVLGSIVGADIADPNIKHMPTVFAVIVIAGFQRLVSKVIIKNKPIKKAITFQPIIIIKEGQLIYKNLKGLDYSVEDILMLLREKDVFEINTVKYGIIESNGNLSILKKDGYEYINKMDMQLEVKPKKLQLPVIIDGEIQAHNLKKLNITHKELLKALSDRNHKTYKNIFLALMDNEKNLHISTYTEE
ncbi:uncharacterized membrane protein YcaP (DUF421 family) [Natranaerovirga hydrolytica]|uniref:Uncharacterized membrane protein YcaP (DUF421 family) n=1 Tax=Natranaerovirga hydrolytica TaxID=680378 RepID=A0A4R1MHI1_9FIRM|nr:DUF421 domain-containing protein [Natranaerovirga hydrolytica]TCK90594.1 uncharacterized membrane protein YcaP (DUF421 family) [Natranaerovirga hydrolytica]